MSTSPGVGEMPAREYETIYILRSDTSKEAAQKVADRTSDAIGKEGGKLTGVENWGRRQLAYAVAKQRRGVYVYLKYLGGGAVVTELERNLRMLDHVLKFQTVLINDAVDASTVQVDPTAIVFDAVEPPGEDEAEETLEQRLGLVEGARRVRHDDDSDHEDSDDADDVVAPSVAKARAEEAAKAKGEEPAKAKGEEAAKAEEPAKAPAEEPAKAKSEEEEK